MINYKLSEVLGKRRIKVKTLSKETGLSYVTLCNLYNNKPINITIKLLDRLLNYLNCDIKDLIEFEK